MNFFLFLIGTSRSDSASAARRSGRRRSVIGRASNSDGRQPRHIDDEGEESDGQHSTYGKKTSKTSGDSTERKRLSFASSQTQQGRQIDQTPKTQGSQRRRKRRMIDDDSLDDKMFSRVFFSCFAMTCSDFVLAVVQRKTIVGKKNVSCPLYRIKYETRMRKTK